MSSLKQSCPGSKEIKSPYPEEIVCVYCGATVEIWSDETETECAVCKKTITRDMKMTCLEWCPAAEQCVGTEKYQKIMKALKKEK